MVDRAPFLSLYIITDAMQHIFHCAMCTLVLRSSKEGRALLAQIVTFFVCLSPLFVLRPEASRTEDQFVFALAFSFAGRPTASDIIIVSL